MSNSSKCLVVQSDGTLLLEVHHSDARALRPQLAAVARLEKSPEYFHEYRLTPISLWNAAQSGWTGKLVMELLESNARYPVPKSLEKMICMAMASFGRIELRLIDTKLVLSPRDESDMLLTELAERKSLANFFKNVCCEGQYFIDPAQRGALKVAMIRAGYPIRDCAGFRDGAKLNLEARDCFKLRDYQQQAVESFFADQGGGGGSGVVVLPCGAGKTIVALGTILRLQTETLILTPNITSLRQWKQELLNKTTLSADMIAEYSGKSKNIAPITLATYQVMSHRRSSTDSFTHLDLFSDHDWGLICYDEVHLLPAPVFRFTAEIQARRRLGLTATLVREDEREEEVFTLIGPRIYELPWRELERDGYIAKVKCIETRVNLPREQRGEYDAADLRHRFRLSSENERKIDRLKEILKKHAGERVLVIGQYLSQLRRIEIELGAPLITGQTPQVDRDRLYTAFRAGDIPVLIVSKVGNHAVDLPDASVAIQLSGTFGSRQEEAQRLGRILRPKSDGRPAFFYAIVTRDTRDQHFAQRRQRFLIEQGYQYDIEEVEPEVSA